MRVLAFKVGMWLIEWSGIKPTPPVSTMEAISKMSDMMRDIEANVFAPNPLLKKIKERSDGEM